MKKYYYKTIFEDGTESIQVWENPVVLTNTEANTTHVIKSLEFMSVEEVADAPVVEALSADVVEAEPQVIEAELV